MIVVKLEIAGRFFNNLVVGLVHRRWLRNKSSSPMSSRAVEGRFHVCFRERVRKLSTNQLKQHCDGQNVYVKKLILLSSEYRSENGKYIRRRSKRKNRRRNLVEVSRHPRLFCQWWVVSKCNEAAFWLYVVWRNVFWLKFH